MRTVLVTGFEPFDGAADNPSAMLVAALLADPPPGMRLHGVVLPVSYAATGAALRAAVARVRPDILISTGLAGGRIELCVERVAVNVDDSPIPDNDGERRIDRPVAPGGPAAYFSALPIKAMAAAVRAAGVPARVSQTAGTFLCNHVFYLGCHLAATAHPGLAAGFIHVPWLPSQAAARPGEPSMGFADMLGGLRAALGAAVLGGADIAVAEGAVS